MILSTFKAVVPTSKKADTFVEKMKKMAVSVPGPFGMTPQVGGAEFFEQEFDPKLNRLVAKDIANIRSCKSSCRYIR